MSHIVYANKFCVVDIETALKKLKPKYSHNMGPHRISSFFLHDCATVLPISLNILFNLSFKNVVSPNFLKNPELC